MLGKIYVFRLKTNSCFIWDLKFEILLLVFSKQ
jgi:hypothetical protein